MRQLEKQDRIRLRDEFAKAALAGIATSIAAEDDEDAEIQAQWMAEREKLLPKDDRERDTTLRQTSPDAS